MTERKIRLIIFFVCLALIGLISTQLFWISKALHTGQSQFQHRVHMVLKDVIRDLEYAKDTNHQFNYLLNDSLTCLHPGILNSIDTLLLDSLLRKYTTYQNLPDKYFYQIVHSGDDSIVFGSDASCCKGIKECNIKPYKACLSGLWRQEPYHIQLLFPTQNRHIFLDIASWLFLSVIFLIIIIVCFVFVIITVIRQKKISEIKNDFINNMTHEFKTPISTISLASEILLQSENDNSEKVKKYAHIIYDENQRMRMQVEKVLNMALIDRGEYSLNKEIIDVHEHIRKTVDKLCLDQCNNNANVKFEFNAMDHFVNLDPVHFTNIVNNLVDNALKYNDKEPRILIKTVNKYGGICISFSDNGIGMSSDAISRIFDKFYRVPTGNIHNVKGFGLGLNYVKIMTEVQGGSINVKSEISKGSTFELIFPFFEKDK